MRKGCLLTLLLYGVLVAAYRHWGSRYWDPPATWIVPLVAAGISFLALGGLWNGWNSARDGRLVRRARLGLRPRDEKRAAALGRISPVREPLETPFSKTPAVFYEYEIRPPNSRATDNSGVSAGGFRLEPCVVRDGTLETIVLGLPDLNNEPGRECRSLKHYLAARQLVERVEFVDLSGAKVVSMLSQVFQVMGDDDGSIDVHWQRSSELNNWLHIPALDRLLEQYPDGEVPAGAELSNDDDDEGEDDDTDADDSDSADDDDEGFAPPIAGIPGAPTLVEKFVAPGDEVCLFGWYSQVKGGLVPSIRRHNVMIRMLRGSPDAIEAQLRKSFWSGLIGGFVALVILHLALWGGTLAYQHDPGVQREHANELNDLLRSGDRAAIERALAQTQRYDWTKTLLTLRDQPELVPLLVAAGADVDATDNYGLTPLMEAARSGNVEMVEALLAAGASIEQRAPQSHRTALMMAIDSQQSATMAVLRKAGAIDDTVTAENGEPVVGVEAGPIVTCVRYIEAIHAQDADRLRSLAARESGAGYEGIDWDTWHNTRPEGEVDIAGYANDTAATMTVRGQAPKGFTVTWVFQLVHEGDEWKILRERWVVHDE